MRISSSIEATRSEIASLGIDFNQLVEDLTLPNPEYSNQLRFGKRRFYKKVDKNICYLNENGGVYLIPRYYIGEPNGDFGNKGRSLESTHSIRLRDYQDVFLRENSSVIDSTTGLLVEAPCGHGKTVLSLWLAYYRGVQTMIIVPTHYLAKQWQQRIGEYTSGSCVIVKSDDMSIPTDSDFTIIVTDLFNCRVLPDELINNVGHVILDEAHRMGAETYLPILNEIPARFRTALTATFRRNDGVHKILRYHFGTHIKMPNRFPNPSAYAFNTGISVQGCVSTSKPYEHFLHFMEENYTGEKLQQTKGAIVYDSHENTKLVKIADSLLKDGSINKAQHRQILACLNRGVNMSYATVESFLNESSRRRKLTIKLIQECLDAGRTVLFLSKRKDVLRVLHKYFEKYNPMLIVSETNVRTDEEEKYLQEECRLIFGVNQLAKEGLDIDRLDTLIIYLPMADTEQAIGRISRLCDGKKNPTAFYLLDNCPLTYATFTKAKKSFCINADYKGEVSFMDIDELRRVLE